MSAWQRDIAKVQQRLLFFVFIYFFFFGGGGWGGGKGGGKSVTLTNRFLQINLPFPWVKCELL